MKSIGKFIIILSGILGFLIIILIINTLTFKSHQVKSEPIENPIFNDQGISHLSRAVTFPTISYSPESSIDTTVFNDYLKFISETYPLVNTRLTKEVFNNFSLLYKWQGKNSSLKPVILLAHFDVVSPGDTNQWEKGPFSGENDGTYIWGRGTLDDKAGMISILESVEHLLSESFEPERTCYLSFGHDEEIHGTRGARIIAASLKNLGVEAEFILDEGNAIFKGLIPLVKKPVALVGTSEKGYVSVKLTIEMAGGHSSLPEKESALIVLNKSFNKLVENQMKARITGPFGEIIEYIGPELPLFSKVMFANSWLFKRFILRIYENVGLGNALIRTTTAPTIIQGGIKDNVIPTKAEAVFNFRILPGETTDDVMNHIQRIVKDQRIKTTLISDERRDPPPASPVNTFGFTNILTAFGQVYPEAILSPTVMVASSDSKHFLEISKNIYRFAPLMITSEDITRFHGINERIKIEDFNRGIQFYYQLIKISL